MNEPLTAEELHCIRIGYVENELLAKLVAIAEERDRLRAAIEKHKEGSGGRPFCLLDRELWEALK